MTEATILMAILALALALTALRGRLTVVIPILRSWRLRRAADLRAHERAVPALARGPLVLVLLLSAAGASCARRTAIDSSADGGPVGECTAYLDSYRECIRRLSPASPQIADARVAAARAALEQITDQEKLRQACVSAAAQLRAACP